MKLNAKKSKLIVRCVVYTMLGLPLLFVALVLIDGYFPQGPRHPTPAVGFKNITGYAWPINAYVLVNTDTTSTQMLNSDGDWRLVFEVDSATSKQWLAHPPWSKHWHKPPLAQNALVPMAWHFNSIPGVKSPQQFVWDTKTFSSTSGATLILDVKHHKVYLYFWQT